MKFVLIFALLILGGSIYVLANFGTVVNPFINSIEAQEGSVDAIQNAAQNDGFAQKYKTFLDQRTTWAKIAIVFDDATFARIAQGTHDRYQGTPLATDPGYGYQIVNLAQSLSAHGQWGNAANLYKEYLTSFPNGPDAQVASSGLMGLRVNHGTN